MSDTEPLKQQRRLGVFGQSHGIAWRERHLARDSFVATRKRMRDRAAWTFFVWSPGGSAALRDFAPPTSDKWWFDVDRDEPGPILNRLLAELNAADDAPTEILWTQGQAEALRLARNPDCMTPAEFTERYIEGVRRILETIRTAIAPECWRKIPAYVEIIGCGAAGDRPCFQTVRNVQREMITRLGAAENIRPGAEAPLDVPLLDKMHPSPAGEAIMGWLTARAIR